MEAKPHLHTLDFLRGLAAISVVAFHYSDTGLRKLRVEANAELFSWGHYGVEIFFVISGFIIPYVLCHSQYRLRNFGSFLGKRFVRISGPAYVMLVLNLGIFFLIDYFGLSENRWFGSLTDAQVLHNFAFTIPFTKFSWVDPVFWTLSVEFQFYLVAGLAYGFMYRNVRNFVVSGLLIGCVFFTPFTRQAELFAYSSLFLIGGLGFLYFEKRITATQFALLLATAAVWCVYQQNLLSAMFGSATALFICFAQVKNSMSAFFGKISYSLYLTHIFIGLTLEGILIRIFPSATDAGRIGLFVFCLACAVLGAYVFHRIFETRFIKLSNTLFGRNRTANAATQPLPAASVSA